jgi:AcrR family transcriptional regulator
MARPRGIADEQLLAAAQELLYEVGPAAFTLEKSASRAGVSAATLIKRFGSKRQLPLALNRRWVASIGPGEPFDFPQRDGRGLTARRRLTRRPGESGRKCRCAL